MRYLMTFSYDGSKYNGYQKQPNMLTIQEILEAKLTQLNSNNHVNLVASGRTDKGVHAYNQKAHFDLNKEISVDRIKYSLNKMLEEYIYIKAVETVDDNFHARFSSKKKIYEYKINMNEINIIDKDYIFQLGKKLDIEKMKEASTYLLGEHDFTSFTKEADVYENCIRIIYSIDYKVIDGILYIEFKGNGFMRYQIRNMVGSLIEVGLSNKKPMDIKQIIEFKDRKKAGKTAPACGLYLKDVIYE